MERLMSDKYILRSGAIDAIKRNRGTLYTKEAEFLFRKVCSILKNAPAADVAEVVRCKVGDTVYFALFGRIIEKQVFSIVSFSKSTRIYCGGTSEYFRPEDIGKTVFLTSEEAEKAMKGETEK